MAQVRRGYVPLKRPFRQMGLDVGEEDLIEDPAYFAAKYGDMDAAWARECHAASSKIATWWRKAKEGKANFFKLAQMLDDDGGRTVFDVAMDDPPGGEASVTDTWVHIVLAVSQESVNVYINGRDVCPRRGPGGGGG